MGEREQTMLPRNQRILEVVGENLKLARLRRKLSTEQVSERAGIARSTLWQLENGSQGVSIGIFLKVLTVLGLEKELEEIGQEDPLGRKLQDASLVVKERAPKRRKND